MKKTFVISLILCGLLTRTATAESGMVRVLVSGIVCAFCSQGLTKTFQKQPAVETVRVNLDDKIVSLTFRKGQELSNEKIESIISDAGFSVVKIQR